MRIAYIRVSTVEQNEERQRLALEKYNIEKWFIDKKSGKNTDRIAFKVMMNYLRSDSDDVLYVSELSRLARSTMDLYKIMETLKNKGVTLISDTENIDTSTASGRAMFGFLAVMAQFERELIRERQADGIAVAKKAGKRFGRPCCKINDSEFNKCFAHYQQRLVTISDIARILGVSRATTYRLIAKRKSELKDKM